MEKQCVYIEMKEPNGETFQTSVEVNKSINKDELIAIGKEIKVCFEKSKNIIVEFQVYNSISETWMSMASYYANESKFIKH